MQPERKTYAEVEALNEVLRQELGHPVYAWKWSGDIRIAVRKEDAAGKPEFDYVKDPETGFLLAQPVYYWREVCYPQVEDQWVFTRKMHTSRAVFLAQFGSALLWPENGEWIPCCAGTGYVALPKGCEPDETNTWEAIRLIRSERAESAPDQRMRLSDLMDRREKRSDAKRRDYVRDRLPAFGGIPGTKMDYSFGGIDAPKKKEKTVA